MNRNAIYRNHADAPLDGILKDLQSVATRPFDEARPIPAAVNHSEAFYNLERQAVFMREWICVGRADEIAAPGDFLTHDILDL